MPDSATVNFHRDARAECFRAWRDSSGQSHNATQRSEAGFSLLEHTGMLYLCTGDRRYIEELADAQATDLVLNACQWIAGLNLTIDSRSLLEPETLDFEQIAEIEMILLRRHAIQAVIFMMRELGDIGEPHQRRAIADAVCVVAELDDVLLARPDVTSIASRILDPVREDLVVQVKPEEYWWLFWARNLDAAFEAEDLPSDIIGALSRSSNVESRACADADSAGRSGAAADAVGRQTFPRLSEAPAPARKVARSGRRAASLDVDNTKKD